MLQRDSEQGYYLKEEIECLGFLVLYARQTVQIYNQISEKLPLEKYTIINS